MNCKRNWLFGVVVALLTGLLVVLAIIILNVRIGVSFSVPNAPFGCSGFKGNEGCPSFKGAIKIKYDDVRASSVIDDSLVPPDGGNDLSDEFVKKNDQKETELKKR